MSWYPRLSTGTLSRIQMIPKVDLHRHLEGSLRLDTLRCVAQQHDIEIPFDEFQSLVQMQHHDPLTFSNFLSKFQTLRLFYCSPEIIQQITREAVEDAANDGVVYLELRFTPVALARAQGFPLADVMDWVAQAAEEAGQAYGVKTRLIASVNRHEPVELAEEVAQLAAQRIGAGIVGLDLAGNEAHFSAKPFSGVFREAHESGLRLTAHAGEWGGAENVREAILWLGAERIGHGVRVCEDPYVMALAREREIPLEVCITSNYQSGVVPVLEEHPLTGLLDAGLRVTLNTDDPSVSAITLTDEYYLAMARLGLTAEALTTCILTAARCAFLPGEEKYYLETELTERLSRIISSP